jgi:hypothetical protein
VRYFQILVDSRLTSFLALNFCYWFVCAFFFFFFLIRLLETNGKDVRQNPKMIRPASETLSTALAFLTDLLLGINLTKSTETDTHSTCKTQWKMYLSTLFCGNRSCGKGSLNHASIHLFASVGYWPLLLFAADWHKSMGSSWSTRKPFTRYFKSRRPPRYTEICCIEWESLIRTGACQSRAINGTHRVRLPSPSTHFPLWSQTAWCLLLVRDLNYPLTRRFPFSSPS